jgi:hypothetical protein
MPDCQDSACLRAIPTIAPVDCIRTFQLWSAPDETNDGSGQVPARAAVTFALADRYQSRSCCGRGSASSCAFAGGPSGLLIFLEVFHFFLKHLLHFAFRLEDRGHFHLELLCDGGAGLALNGGQAAFGREVKLWDVASTQEILTLPVLEDREERGRRVSAIRFFADGQRLIAALEDGTCQYWDAAPPANGWHQGAGVK